MPIPDKCAHPDATHGDAQLLKYIGCACGTCLLDTHLNWQIHARICPYSECFCRRGRPDGNPKLAYELKPCHIRPNSGRNYWQHIWHNCQLHFYQCVCQHCWQHPAAHCVARVASPFGGETGSKNGRMSVGSAAGFKSQLAHQLG